mmetsp:Transcript_16142/g.24248  ORF Transcript_16142/g.24248 Transcript_16142/m.24248 type:complete len:295 (-) Transcript_16142:8-892(-)
MMSNALFLILLSLLEIQGTRPDFRGTWHEDGRIICDAAQEQKELEPHHCRIVVVGAAWSGVYFAWRLAVDSGVVNASEVCIFEASGRVGGRVDSVRGLPSLGDLVIDLGGYRFIETDLLPAQIVWKALDLPTSCYDYHCRPPASEGNGCEGAANCFVIRDSYGNNAGYATAIESMLGQIEDKGGIGQRQTYFGYTLTNVTITNTSKTTNSSNKSLMDLVFSSGTVVRGVETLLLALPHNALSKVQIQPALSSPVTEVLEAVRTSAFNKVYAYYADAWWCSKLGLMEGNFFFCKY